MKLNDLSGLKCLNNSLNYEGKQGEYQKYGKTNYQQVKLNTHQSLLYDRSLYGLAKYSKEEINQMHKEKKARIQKVNRKAQKSLNLFKQEVVNDFCNIIYNTYFKNNEVMKLLLLSEENETDPKFMNTLSFKDLNITKEKIINRFIKEGLLPKNFYELK